MSYPILFLPAHHRRPPDGGVKAGGIQSVISSNVFGISLRNGGGEIIQVKSGGIHHRIDTVIIQKSVGQAVESSLILCRQIVIDHRDSSPAPVKTPNQRNLLIFAFYIDPAGWIQLHLERSLQALSLLQHKGITALLPGSDHGIALKMQSRDPCIMISSVDDPQIMGSG